jgi:repressor LexA
MRRKDESKKPIIADFINSFYYEHDKVPSVREIVEGTGIPLSTVHRYLVDMQEKGELSYNGYRSARTKEMSEVSPIHGIAVLGTVACGPGQEEEQRFVETIRMPETLVEKGDYFALIAKGESMIGAGVHPGDYVIVRRQQTARPGDLIIALSDGKNNLKKLALDEKNQKHILQSCNPDKESFPDIIVDDLQIQGIAIGVYHRLEKEV